MYEEIKHYDHGIVGGLWLYDSLIKKIEENDEKLFILIESESSNKNENFLNLIKDSDFSFNFVKKLFKEYSLEIKNINSFKVFIDLCYSLLCINLYKSPE